MTKYSRFISINFIITLLAFVLVSGMVIFQKAQQAQNIQAKHHSALSKTLTHITDNKVAIRILKSNFDYNSLIVTDSQGNDVHAYNKADSTSFDLIKLVGLAPKAQQQNLKVRDLKVTYLLDYQAYSAQALELIAILFLVSLALTAVISFFAIKLAKRNQQTALDDLASQVNNALINITQGAQGAASRQLSLAYPALEQSISQLEQFLTQVNDEQEGLQESAYSDALTQLPNRNSFLKHFNEEVKADNNNFGALLLVRSTELQIINKISGYQQGDQYIKEVAKLIGLQLNRYENAGLYRLNGSDFAALIPNITTKEAESLGEKLTGQFNQYQDANDLDSVATTGIVGYYANKEISDILAAADTAISIAQTSRKNGWHLQKDNAITENGGANLGNQNWKNEIALVIAHRQLELLAQPIQPTGHKNKVYSEVLARFFNASGEVLPTSSFIAMAEKLDKIIEIDKLIIESLIDLVRSQNLINNNFGINLSPRSLHDDHFAIWLERRLLKESNIASQLVFEISEFGLQQNAKASKTFIAMLHRCGARATVERFGVGLTSFKFFREIKPDFIKMDSSYTRGIDNDNHNQYFLRLMVDLCHRLNISVLAENVESQEEKHSLERLFVDGCQGYYIEKPNKI